MFGLGEGLELYSSPFFSRSDSIFSTLQLQLWLQKGNVMLDII